MVDGSLAQVAHDGEVLLPREVVGADGLVQSYIDVVGRCEDARIGVCLSQEARTMGVLHHLDLIALPGHTAVADGLHAHHVVSVDEWQCEGMGHARGFGIHYRLVALQLSTFHMLYVGEELVGRGPDVVADEAVFHTDALEVFEPAVDVPRGDREVFILVAFNVALIDYRLVDNDIRLRGCGVEFERETGLVEDGAYHALRHDTHGDFVVEDVRVGLLASEFQLDRIVLSYREDGQCDTRRAEGYAIDSNNQTVPGDGGVGAVETWKYDKAGNVSLVGELNVNGGNPTSGNTLDDVVRNPDFRIEEAHRRIVEGGDGLVILRLFLSLVRAIGLPATGAEDGSPVTWRLIHIHRHRRVTAIVIKRVAERLIILVGMCFLPCLMGVEAKTRLLKNESGSTCCPCCSSIFQICKYIDSLVISVILPLLVGLTKRAVECGTPVPGVIGGFIILESNDFVLLV